jgi:hypothetical protein
MIVGCGLVEIERHLESDMMFTYDGEKGYWKVSSLSNGMYVRDLLSHRDRGDHREYSDSNLVKIRPFIGKIHWKW